MSLFSRRHSSQSGMMTATAAARRTIWKSRARRAEQRKFSTKLLAGLRSRNPLLNSLDVIIVLDEVVVVLPLRRRVQKLLIPIRRYTMDMVQISALEFYRSLVLHRVVVRALDVV